MIKVHRDFNVSLSSLDQADVIVPYWIKGTSDEFEARAALMANADAVYDGRQAAGYTIDRRGPATWEARVTYSAQEWEYQFEVSTQDVLTTQSLQTVKRYAPDGQTAPNFAGAIGVTRDGIQGTQVPVAVRSWSETHYFDPSLIDLSYQETLDDLTGCMNQSTFRGRPRGSVLFDGASGGLQRGKRQMAINFKFRYSRNVTALTIGEISGIEKLGWDYLWLHYLEVPDMAAGRMARVVDSAHVERVIRFGDLSKLRLPT